MTRQFFTPAEANRTLPLVKRIVADILDHGRRYRALAAVIENADDAAEPVEPVEVDRQLDALQDELRGLFAELTAIGCEYKDWGFDTGLVDFPGQLEGRTVLWCWRSDEEAVTWYHDLDAGFAGREPIPAALLAADANAPA